MQLTNPAYIKIDLLSDDDLDNGLIELQETDGEILHELKCNQVIAKHRFNQDDSRWSQLVTANRQLEDFILELDKIY